MVRNCVRLGPGVVGRIGGLRQAWHALRRQGAALWQAVRHQGPAAWLVEVPLLASIVSAIVLAGTTSSAHW